MQIGWQVLLMSDQTVYFLINKHNMIQRCQELFNVHPDPGLCGVQQPSLPSSPPHSTHPGQSFRQVGALKDSSALFPFPLPSKALGQLQSQGWLSLTHHLFFTGLFWPVKALIHHQEVCSGKILSPAQPGDPDREDHLIPHLTDDASMFRRHRGEGRQR